MILLGYLSYSPFDYRQRIWHGLNIQSAMGKIARCDGFIAALDQNGGSTPKALDIYGIGSNHYDSDAMMFDAVHTMRSRIITSPSFNGDRILAAILFEDTLKRDISGINSADYLWQEKNIVPLIKVDKGLLAESDGVQLMKPMPELNALLMLANNKQVFGTKMRSVIKAANDKGINQLVNQQFTVAKQIIAAGLVPIIEPEVDIHADDKADIETLLRAALLNELNALTDDQTVMLKLTLPSQKTSSIKVALYTTMYCEQSLYQVVITAMKRIKS